MDSQQVGPNNECLPLSSLPGVSALFRDYSDASAAANPEALRRWYPSSPFEMAWAATSPTLDAAQRTRLADALSVQQHAFRAGAAALANVEKIRNGAAVVVTGQQVGLFGGPLLTLLKAATAVRKAADATKATGRDYVPVFWLASEDHDLAEVDQVALLSKNAVETLRLGLHAERPVPVGKMSVGDASVALEQASELLGWAPAADVLRECYAPDAQGVSPTLAQAFGRFVARVFAEQGLIVMDAAPREFHAMGAHVLRGAIERADELEAALLARSAELVAGGYHAQVLVAPGHSLLFLLDPETGARTPLRRTTDGAWKAGARTYTTAELLEILAAEPERLSPNALLRPVFQDAILPTAAYIGGPAEIAYFAQSEVLYAKLLARVTPVLPRLSATLVEPAIAKVMAQHETSLTQIFEAKKASELAQRLGARAMPIEGKRKLAAVGNAMDAELTALTVYMTAMSADLGRSAGVSASKMRYQMNRLRRMAAAYEVQKSAHVMKHAQALMLNLFPEEHLQERLLAGGWFLAKYGDALPALLVEHAGQECPGHRVIHL